MSRSESTPTPAIKAFPERLCLLGTVSTVSLKKESAASSPHPEGWLLLRPGALPGPDRGAGDAASPRFPQLSGGIGVQGAELTRQLNKCRLSSVGGVLPQI